MRYQELYTVYRVLFLFIYFEIQLRFGEIGNPGRETLALFAKSFIGADLNILVVKRGQR